MDLPSLARWVSGGRQISEDKLKLPCRLPGHPDDDSQLSVLARQANGKLLVGCFGGLSHSREKVLEAYGLSTADLEIDRPAPQESPSLPPTAPAAAFSGNGTHSAPSKFKHAIAYARRGFAVFPCHNIDPDGECSCGKLKCASAGKHPRYKDWQKDATLEEGQIRRWWAEYPDSNIGVACGARSQLTVLDVDGQTGRDTLRQLELDNGELPETPVVLTGSGGAHYYFLHSPGVGNAVRFAPGLDIRTDGGLVVGVGSVTKNPYRWEVQATLGEVSLGAMPTWLAGLIKAAQTPQTNGERFKLPNLDQMVEGSGRQAALYKAIRSMRLQGLAEEAIREIATSINHRMKQPLDQSEFRLTIEHALSQPDREGFVPALTNGHLPATVDQAQEVLICESAEQAVVSNAEYLSRPAIIERLDYTHHISLGVGGKHEGKTTATRTEALAVSMGKPVYGRATSQTPVIYAASDDEYPTTRMELLRMGWRSDVPLTLVQVRRDEASDPQRVLRALAQLAREKGAHFLVLDMLFDFIRVQDEIKYAHTREAIGFIQNLADEIDGHVKATHHTPKWMPDAATAAKAALGSQGIAARFSPILLSRMWADDLYTIESTMTRDPRGLPIPPTCIKRTEDGWAETTEPFKSWMKWRLYSGRILGLFEGEEGKEYTVQAVAQDLTINRPEAQNALYQMCQGDDAVLERYKPSKGRGYKYRLKTGGLFGTT